MAGRIFTKSSTTKAAKQYLAKCGWYELFFVVLFINTRSGDTTIKIGPLKILQELKTSIFGVKIQTPL